MTRQLILDAVSPKSDDLRNLVVLDCTCVVIALFYSHLDIVYPPHVIAHYDFESLFAPAAYITVTPLRQLLVK